MEQKKAVTIYDIARAAKVSPGTVSRFINGVGEPRAATRERLEKAIADYNFVPNRAAQALKSKRNRIICMAFPEAENPFFYHLVSAAEKITQQYGYTLMIYHTHTDSAREFDILSLMNESIADGLFLINYNFTQRHLDTFYKVSCPLVISSLCISPYGGTGFDNFDYIGIDGQNALYTATTQLISDGHRRIAFVGGKRDIVMFRERYEGYCSALARSRIHLDPSLCFFGGWDKDAGYAYGERIAAMPKEQRPTAVCAVNDVVAIGLISALRDHGLNVPDDLSVIGMDNIDMDVDLNPSLSSSDFAKDEFCKCAIDFLMERINGNDNPARKIIFQPTLILRESSAKCKEQL